MHNIFLVIAMTLTLSNSQAALSLSSNHDSANMASPYVELDSWVYPAFDRLSAAGMIQTGFTGLRPWTRLECARLLQEMADANSIESMDNESVSLYAALSREFAAELQNQNGVANVGAQVDSSYIRSETITGTPITDGYHAAQTVVNDFGRPYGRGENLYSGVSAHFTAGPIAGFGRVEVQRAGTATTPPATALSSIAAADFTPAAAAGPAGNFTRGRALDAYITFNLRNNQFTFGRQSLWWGPGKGGPLLFSNNAEPITMLRYDRVRPVKLPWIAGLLGPVRMQFFVGRLSGQQFAHTPAHGAVGGPGVALGDQPFIHGQKVSFKPTPNFEFSVSRTTIFGGPAFSVTFSSFWRSLVATGNSDGTDDPGDRRVGFDVQYRVPGLRDWLTVYADTFTDDEPFPLAYPTQSAWSPGFYLAKLPHLPRADFRAEGFLTPPRIGAFPGFYYFNVHYLSGYTNDRQLIGSWIGREGSGAQLWSTWWFSPRSSVQTSYRAMSVNDQFLQGGNLRDLSLAVDLALRPNWSVHISSQFEHWRFPLFLSPATNNVTLTAQLMFTPGSKAR